MKTAGMAFTKGFFGTLGAGAAIFGTVGITVLVGERVLKKLLRNFTDDVRKKTEDLIDHPHDMTRMSDDSDDSDCTCGHEGCWAAAHHSDHCAYKKTWFESWEGSESKPAGWQEMYTRIYGN